MGTKDGSIIATIIMIHIPRNDAAAAGHVCPGLRIHAIVIAQPPGIGIAPIADMDAHQTIVTAAPTAKSNAETPRSACREARSALVILIMSVPPQARLAAPLGGPVEALIHPPDAVQSTLICGIGVVEDTSFQRARAQFRPL